MDLRISISKFFELTDLAHFTELDMHSLPGGIYVGRILMGAKPTDLPVVLNLRTAKA
jgi:hypothetical protein